MINNTEFHELDDAFTKATNENEVITPINLAKPSHIKPTKWVEDANLDLYTLAPEYLLGD
jgi:hypothetical protein